MFTLSKISGSATIIESRSDAVNICDAVKVWAMSNNVPVVQVCKSKTKSGWKVHAKMKNGWMVDVIAETHPSETVKPDPTNYFGVLNWGYLNPDDDVYG